MNETQGPAMICATSVVKPGRARIGHIGGNVTLPRTVEIFTLVAVGAGLLIGLALAAFVPTGGSQKYFMGAIFGGVAGWFVVTFSPMKNESLLTWLGLTVKTLRQQRYVEGRPVVLAVGVSLVERESAGRVRLVRGAIRVPEGTVDDRGVPRSAANRNLPEGAIAAAGGFVTGVSQAMPAMGARAMPTDAEVSSTPSRRHVVAPVLAPSPAAWLDPAVDDHGQSALGKSEDDRHALGEADHGGTLLGAPVPAAPQESASPAEPAWAQQSWQSTSDAQPHPGAPAGAHPPTPAPPVQPGVSAVPGAGPTATAPRLRIRERPTTAKPGKPRKLKD